MDPGERLRLLTLLLHHCIGAYIEIHAPLLPNSLRKQFSGDRPSMQKDDLAFGPQNLLRK